MLAEDNEDDILKGISNVLQEPTEQEEYVEEADNRKKNNKSKPSQGANSNIEKTCYIHKYSKGIPLAEAVILADKPYFIQMKEVEGMFYWIN